MSTESIVAASLTLSRHKEHTAVFLTLLGSNSGVALKVGQEVYVSADLTVTKRSLGSQFPIGIVDVGNTVDADNITVHTVFQRTLKAHAKGGTINAGAFVKPNGTVNADGCPEYVLAVAPSASGGVNTSVVGDYALGIVLKGGVVDSQILLGIFRTPIIPMFTVS